MKGAKQHIQKKFLFQDIVFSDFHIFYTFFIIKFNVLKLYHYWNRCALKNNITNTSHFIEKIVTNWICITKWIYETSTCNSKIRKKITSRKVAFGRKLMHMSQYVIFYCCKLLGAQKSWLNYTAILTKQKSYLKMHSKHMNILDKKRCNCNIYKTGPNL